MPGSYKPQAGRQEETTHPDCDDTAQLEADGPQVGPMQPFVEVKQTWDRKDQSAVPFRSRFDRAAGPGIR